MADRRMFAKAVTGSARFLKMPATSRLLYYDLGMDADDDGCVEAFAVLRKTGATEDDLKVLVTKGFVQILNEDLAVYLADWHVNNHIRKDRYHPGIYRHLVCVSSNPDDNQLATEGRPDQDSRCKDIADQDRVGYGRDRSVAFVPPTLEDVAHYCRMRQNSIDPRRFWEYYSANGWMMHGQSMADWQATIRYWEANEKRKTSQNPFLSMVGADND